MPLSIFSLLGLLQRCYSVNGDCIELILCSNSLPESSKIKKIKTIVEEVVDGKIVSSQVKEIEEKM